MTSVNTYRGYSTVDAERTRNWKQYDVELVKRDLLNHFMTRIGERVMRPEFGCRIWDYIMEQMTPALREDVIQECVRVCKTDPRVELVDVKTFDYPNGIRVEISLNFLGFAAFQSFSIIFDQQITTNFG